MVGCGEFKISIVESFFLDGSVLVQLVVKMKRFSWVILGYYVVNRLIYIRSIVTVKFYSRLGVLAALGRRSSMKQCLCLVNLCESR